MYILKLFFGLFSFIIPTFLLSNYILNHYYNSESFVLDTGWFTYLLSESTSLPIANPLVGVLDYTYFTTHLSLFYYPFSLLYTLLEGFLTPIHYFSLFIGSLYGLIALAIFLAGEKFVSKKSTLFLLFLIAIITPFNGVALGTIGFPHIEIAIPALLLLFVAFYFRGNKYWSYFVVLIILTIREDAGFHLFGLLSIILIAYYLVVKKLASIPKDLIYIALFALFGSILLIAIQKNFFIGDNALERIYLGTPHFAHLSIDFIKDRVEFFLYNRSYLYVPAILLIPLAIWNKNIFLLVPLLSTLPWLLLSFIAITAMPHTFSNYYAFPFIVLVAWPLLAFLINSTIIDSTSPKLFKIITTISLTTGLSIYLFIGTIGHVDNRPWRGFGLGYIQKIENVDRTIDIISHNKELFGNIIYDEAMSSFMIKTLTKDEYGYLNRFSKLQIQKANSIIFFENSLEKIRPILKEKKFHYFYKFNNTDIIIATEVALVNSLFLKI